MPYDRRKTVIPSYQDRTTDGDAIFAKELKKNYYADLDRIMINLKEMREFSNLPLEKRENWRLSEPLTNNDLIRMINSYILLPKYNEPRKNIAHRLLKLIDSYEAFGISAGGHYKVLSKIKSHMIIEFNIYLNSLSTDIQLRLR